MKAARTILQRIETLARISENPQDLTRTFASPAMHRANTLVAAWMKGAGMTTQVDVIGNLIGHYPGTTPNAKILLLGSHLDTVRNAGKFDGPLGVLLAVACVNELHRQRIRLPFAIKVVGFTDEEGVRYQCAYLGSKALAGCFARKELSRKDANGVSMAEAITRFGGNPAQIKSAALIPSNLLGYVEAHIEQGPVLEQKKLAVGIVNAIAGQTRARFRFLGRAGHAGTTPMNLRQDALCAAGEFVLAAEALAKATRGLVATVGEIAARPGAANVIPGEVCLSLDIRHSKDSIRKSAFRTLETKARHIARRRKLQFGGELVQETAAVACSPRLSGLLGAAIKRRQKTVPSFSSGAGHDAAIMARITPAAMLFLRCRKGISHHPDESVKARDVAIALAVLNDFLQLFAEKYRQAGGEPAKTFL
jgi:allantoate deiminase